MYVSTIISVLKQSKNMVGSKFDLKLFFGCLNTKMVVVRLFSLTLQKNLLKNSFPGYKILGISLR